MAEATIRLPGITKAYLRLTRLLSPRFPDPLLEPVLCHC